MSRQTRPGTRTHRIRPMPSGRTIVRPRVRPAQPDPAPVRIGRPRSAGEGLTRLIRRSMVEVADASGGTWRELDAHYVHQSRMIGMAVDIQAWPADSAEYPSALGARLRDLPPVDAMQLLQFLELIPRPEK